MCANACVFPTSGTSGSKHGRGARGEPTPGPEEGQQPETELTGAISRRCGFPFPSRARRPGRRGPVLPSGLGRVSPLTLGSACAAAGEARLRRPAPLPCGREPPPLLSLRPRPSPPGGGSPLPPAAHPALLAWDRRHFVRRGGGSGAGGRWVVLREALSLRRQRGGGPGLRLAALGRGCGQGGGGGWRIEAAQRRLGLPWGVWPLPERRAGAGGGSGCRAARQPRGPGGEGGAA